MEIPLFVPPVILAVLTVPFLYMSKSKEDFRNNPLYLFLTGLAAVSVTYVILLLPTYPLFTSSTRSNYINVIENTKGLLVGMLIIICLISEVLRFKSISYLKFFSENISKAVVFGLAWGIGEIIIRFTNFFPDGYSTTDIFVLLILVILFDIGLVTIYIRAAENTKFVIFGTFMKFIFELAIFGGIGYQLSFNEFLLPLSGIILVELSLAFLSLVVKKKPMTD